MDTIKIEEFINIMNAGEYVTADSPLHVVMSELASDARKITAEINDGYKTQEELRLLFEKLIGKKVDENFRLFPPFYTDCGKNITLGKGVFINSACCF